MRRSQTRRPGLSRRARVSAVAAILACLACAGVASAADGFDPFGTDHVGSTYASGVLLPTNEWVSPLGRRILDPDARLLSSAISPNGQFLAALGWNEDTGYLTIYDLQTGQLVQQTPLAATSPSKDASVAADGPLWSVDGTTLWVPQSADIQRFSVDATTGQATYAASVTLPTSTTTGDALPSGMALSSDGSKLYVALNGANTLGIVDTATNTLTTQIPVGDAPRQVVLADGGAVAYVSNEGGEPANGSQYTNLSDGTPIVASTSTGGAITGTVSVVDLSTDKESREIHVGLQPTALYQDGSALFVANSNDDSMSVIDEATNTVSQTVNTNPVPDVPKVGSYANAISMSDPGHVLVSIGRDNAIAVYGYRGPTTPMRYEGLLPTDWYPVAVAPDPALGKGTIVVTNDKGIGARGPGKTVKEGVYTHPVTGHNTYSDTGSITMFTMPAPSAVAHDTRTVFTDNAWNDIKPIDAGDDDTVPTVIPRHLGGASPIKHIVVIIRENRTYDQLLGDLGEGDGDPAYAQFGKQVTPNYHSLAWRFGDLDNFYDEATLSAAGHNWIVQAEANDYVEKEFGAFYRSYPASGGDALAYQRDGFLWNAAERAGLSVKDFGEYANNFTSDGGGPSPDWDAWYRDSLILQHKAAGPLPVPTHAFETSSDIPSLNRIIDPWFPNFELNIPDQYRVDMWNRYFDRWERNGRMPSLQFMWVMCDHTGAGGGNPDQVAEVADNDLATGRIVDEISHSRFWRSTAIFVMEDDTQNGVDHVDGHRAPALVISPYSRSGVDDQYYTQVSAVRTIEQILGIRPMNQDDGSAEPMYDAFTSHPDFAPYNVVPNQIPLTLGAPGYPSTLTSPPAGSTAAQRADFRPQGIVPASMRSVYEAWMRWGATQPFNGIHARPDAENPALLNRLDWYAAHNWEVAYPEGTTNEDVPDSGIFAPDQVPGRNVPQALLDGDYVAPGQLPDPPPAAGRRGHR